MPKTKEQCLKIKEERRNDILKASLWEFAFKGYAGVKVDDITKSAKCSHGLFYHYFKDTEELFHSLMEEMIVPFVKNIATSIDINNKAIEVLKELLTAIIDSYKDKNTNNACMFYLLFNLHLQKDVLPKPRTMRSEDKKKDHRLYTIFKELIEKGQQEGNIYQADASELTIAILSMLTGLALNRINIDYKKYKCPNGDTIASMLIKKEENK